MRTGVLSFPVYSEAHSRRGAAFASKMNLRDAHATCCTSSISSNSFTSYFFFLHTLSSHFQTLCASNPCAINHFRILCKIPGIGYPPPSPFLDFFDHLPPVTYSFRINTCKSVSKQTTLTPFRMNTYEKRGGGGWRPVFLFLARDKSQGCGIHALAH